MLGQQVTDYIWFNMKTRYQNQFGTSGFSKNDEFYNQEDIIDQTDRIE